MPHFLRFPHRGRLYKYRWNPQRKSVNSWIVFQQSWVFFPSQNINNFIWGNSALCRGKAFFVERLSSHGLHTSKVPPWRSTAIFKTNIFKWWDETRQVRKLRWLSEQFSLSREKRKLSLLNIEFYNSTHVKNKPRVMRWLSFEA